MLSRKNMKVAKTVAMFLAGVATIEIFNMVMVTVPSFEYSSETRVLRLLPENTEGQSHRHALQRRSSEDSIGPVNASGGSGEQRTKCVKSVHIFGTMTRMGWIPELHYFRKLLEASKLYGFESNISCSSHGYGCDIKLTLGTEREHLEGKDAVIFGMVSTTWVAKNLLNNVLKHKPEPGQTWIFYSTETPYRVMKWAGDDDITKFKYHVLMTYHRSSDIPIPFGYYRKFKGSESPKDTRFLSDEFYKNRTGLLSWVATNCNDVFWPRMPFIEQLRKEIDFDDYGACGRKECLPRRSPHCNELFASYKFFLSIPNSECRDYITEKFWMISLQYGTVPLVLGTVKQDYKEVAPPGSFVHFSDFKTIKDAADHLKRVDQDETLYRKYHEWRRHGEVVMPYPSRPGALCRTLPHIYPRQANEFKLLGDSAWFKDCRRDPSKIDLNYQFKNIGKWTPW